MAGGSAFILVTVTYISKIVKNIESRVHSFIHYSCVNNGSLKVIHSFLYLHFMSSFRKFRTKKQIFFVF